MEHSGSGQPRARRMLRFAIVNYLRGKTGWCRPPWCKASGRLERHGKPYHYL